MKDVIRFHRGHQKEFAGQHPTVARRETASCPRKSYMKSAAIVPLATKASGVLVKYTLPIKAGVKLTFQSHGEIPPG